MEISDQIVESQLRPYSVATTSSGLRPSSDISIADALMDGPESRGSQKRQTSGDVLSI